MKSMNDFEKDYAEFEKIKEAYDKADAAGDRAGQEKAREEYLFRITG